MEDSFDFSPEFLEGTGAGSGEVEIELVGEGCLILGGAVAVAERHLFGEPAFGIADGLGIGWGGEVAGEASESGE